jgi:hypothetical protein
MAATLALSTTQLPNPTDRTQQQQIVDGTVTLSGSYTANGDTFSFLGLGINSDQVPNRVEIYEATPAPGPASGYQFVFLPGTNQGNGLMEIFSTEGTQFSGAYGTPPFSITGFALKFRAYFTLFL